MKINNSNFYESLILTFPKEENYDSVRITQSTSNCKLTIVEGFNGLGTPGDQLLKKMKDFLSECNILVYINVNHISYKKFLEDNFEVYESIRIPVGYGGGYQYHIFLRNPYTKYYKGNMRSTEFNKVTNTDKDKLKNIMLATLKNKRRKTDIVDEIINQL